MDSIIIGIDHGYCLNLEKEEDRRAWEYLQNPDADQFRSANQAIVAAII